MAEIAMVEAGIGGLTAAVALRQRGFEVAVFEQASELVRVGLLGPRASPVKWALRRTFAGLGPVACESVVRNRGARKARHRLDTLRYILVF